MQLSIVTTLYQSAPYLDEFLERMGSSAQQITHDYEIILVNDGSPDQSLQKALAAQAQDAHLKIIELSRNFGHHEAGMVGLEAALGNYVFLIDSDLEEAPELILAFWQDMQSNQELDVVYGVQEQRKGNWSEQLFGNLFYRIFNQLSSIKLVPNLLTVRLMKRAFVDAITQYQERNLFVAGIMAHAGFNQQAKVVTKKSKPHSTYTLGRQLKLFITCITSFSSKPLEYCFIVGCCIWFFLLLSSVYFGVQVLVFSVNPSTLQAITLATGFITGSVLTCTGLLGLYVASMTTEIKQRPRAIIKTIYSKLDQ
ncbi:MAG: glycosyltransferase family 2 protein [Methylococcales bacterium]